MRTILIFSFILLSYFSSQAQDITLFYKGVLVTEEKGIPRNAKGALSIETSLATDVPISLTLSLVNTTGLRAIRSLKGTINTIDTLSIEDLLSFSEEDTFLVFSYTFKDEIKHIKIPVYEVE